MITTVPKLRDYQISFTQSLFVILVLTQLTKHKHVAIHCGRTIKMRLMSNLLNIKSEIENYKNESNLTELQIIEKLKTHYFNKEVNENLKLYKKGKKKVSEITKDLKISPRKFYVILEKKKIAHKKYKKGVI